MTQYNVHVYAVVRVLFNGIDAASQQDAARTAMDQFTAEDIQNCVYAEELTGAHVDIVGDSDFGRSKSFGPTAEPELAAPATTPALTISGTWEWNKLSPLHQQLCRSLMPYVSEDDIESKTRASFLLTVASRIEEDVEAGDE